MYCGTDRKKSSRRPANRQTRGRLSSWARAPAAGYHLVSRPGRYTTPAPPAHRPRPGCSHSRRSCRMHRCHTCHGTRRASLMPCLQTRLEPRASGSRPHSSRGTREFCLSAGCYAVVVSVISYASRTSSKYSRIMVSGSSGRSVPTAACQFQRT